MAEPLATDGVAKDGGNYCAEEQTTVEHGLEGKSAAERERHAPVGSDITHTRSLTLLLSILVNDIEFSKVVGEISVFGAKAGTTCGEVPVVLTVKGQTGSITDEMFVFERNLHSRFRSEFVAVVHIVPAQSHLQVEVTQVEIDRQKFCL